MTWTGLLRAAAVHGGCDKLPAISIQIVAARYSASLCQEQFMVTSAGTPAQDDFSSPTSITFLRSLSLKSACIIEDIKFNPLQALGVGL